MKRLTTEDFIKRSKEKHGDKYDYSLSKYIGANKKIKIICPIHGLFEQTAREHMDGSNCKYCVNNNIKFTNEIFILKSKKVHGDKYNYDSVNYINGKTKIKIICPEHGTFYQIPQAHLRGDGCSKCSNNYSNKSIFIEKSNKRHNNKYDYSLVEYKNNKTKVKIICPIHGLFEQRPDLHLSSNGCKKCGTDVIKSKTTMKLSTFIKQSKQLHKNKYDYSLVDYINTKTKVKIICQKHGIFEKTPNKHLQGQGCPICKESKGEEQIRTILENNKIKYFRQYKFNDCKNKQPLPFDFYLPELNICIEYDGIQHFKSIDFFGGVDALKYTQNNDKIKNNYCINKNIKLLRIRYNTKNIEKIINDLFI